MTYGELYECLAVKCLHDPNFVNERVTVDDKSEGEYYPCDTIEFTESDYVIDKDQFF